MVTTQHFANLIDSFHVKWMLQHRHPSYTMEIIVLRDFAFSRDWHEEFRVQCLAEAGRIMEAAEARYDDWASDPL
jgi:hypothetical protein